MQILSNYNSILLVLLFFIITYLFSVFEKVTDIKGYTNFLKSHFKNTKIKNLIPIGFYILVVMEFASLVLLIIGTYLVIKLESTVTAKIGLEFSALTLLVMLIGQRFAKDYQGAMLLAVYFILNVFGLFLMQ